MIIAEQCPHPTVVRAATACALLVLMQVWELFETDCSKRVALKSCHDCWLSMRHAQADGKVVQSDNLDWWETFELIPVDPNNNKVALHSCHDSKILKAYPEGDLVVETYYKNEELNGGHWEALTLQPVQGIDTTTDANLGGNHLNQRWIAHQANLGVAKVQDAVQKSVAAGGHDFVKQWWDYITGKRH
jgi:hypothetical protein